MIRAEDVAARHAYLAKARPDFKRSMAGIVNEGGPWACSCGAASLLVWRCSACGRDLTGENNTHEIQ